MPARPESPPAAGRSRPGRPVKLSREVIVNAALTFLDREGWDALTINALAAQLGTKGPSLYNHVSSLNDLRREMRLRVIDDIVEMLAQVGDDAVLTMAAAYRSYAHHHPGRYSAFTRMPLSGEDPEYTAAATRTAAPVIEMLFSYGLDGDTAYYAALEIWAALHGFVLLEMTGVMDEVDTDAVFGDMVRRLMSALATRAPRSEP